MPEDAMSETAEAESSVAGIGEFPAAPPRPIVLDGGLSNALLARGHDLSGQLWTARLLRDEPAAIAAVHRDYFAAGAQVATTASYQGSIDGFVELGLSRTDARRLLASSVSIARGVRDELAGEAPSEGPRWVAASVGPYGAVLADGSEYRGRYGVSAARLRAFHAERLEVLAEAGPDLIAVETVPDVDEAEVLVELLDAIGLPAWFSYTITDPTRTAAGQPLAEAFAVAGSAATVFAVGVNCCPPDLVLPAIETAVGLTGKPAVAYPNRGQTWDPQRRSWVGGGSFDRGLAAAWVGAGARYVGGCCQVGPDDIADLATAMRDRERD